MRRRVAVSKGTFFGEGVGAAGVGDSKTLLLLVCSASMTERALASESLRGRVTGLDSGVAGASYFGFGGAGEV